MLLMLKIHDSKNSKDYEMSKTVARELIKQNGDIDKAHKMWRKAKDIFDRGEHLTQD